MRFGTELLKRGFAKMQKGGVVMDVTNAEQAAIAEEAGSVAVMALERVPADIRAAGGVARMADPVKIQEIMDSVTVPVMAKCRIGHEAEARALESMGVDMIDESEVLTPADPFFHVNKRGFSVPFVCGCRNLGEAVRRVWEGAAMIRTKGEAGTGDIIEAVRHVRLVNGAIAELKSKNKEQLYLIATKFADSYTVLLKEIRSAHGELASVSEADVVFANENLDTITEGLFQILTEVKKIQRLPVVNFAAGGVATPADAALMMLMGCDGVFVGAGIFKSENPQGPGRGIVAAGADFDDPSTVAEGSKGLGLARKGLDAKALPVEARLEGRDGLSLHLVPLVHRPVEKARGIEDLVAVYAAVKVAERHPFRREGVVRHLRTAARGRSHERALADVRVARDHDRRNRRVNLWDSPQSDSSVDQGVEVGRDLIHDGRETTVRLAPQFADRVPLGAADPPAVVAGDVSDLVGSPVERGEMLFQSAQVEED